MHRWLTRIEQASRRLAATRRSSAGGSVALAPAGLLARVALRGVVAMAVVVGMAVLGGALALMLLGAVLERLGLIRFGVVTNKRPPGSGRQGGASRQPRSGPESAARPASERDDVFDAEYRVVEDDPPEDRDR